MPLLARIVADVASDRPTIDGCLLWSILILLRYRSRPHRYGRYRRCGSHPIGDLISLVHQPPIIRKDHVIEVPQTTCPQCRRLTLQEIGDTVGFYVALTLADTKQSGSRHHVLRATEWRKGSGHILSDPIGALAGVDPRVGRLDIVGEALEESVSYTHLRAHE